MIKPLAPALALSLLCGPRQEALELDYAPEPGTVLARRFEAHATYERTQLELSVDGEPLELGEVPDFEMDFLELIRVSDELVGVEDGRPTELLRTFDELRQENQYKSDDQEAESTDGSPLEGHRVRYTHDDDGGEFASEGDDELDEDLLADLIEDMDLRGVLPDHEVEVGDEWPLDARVYLPFLWPGGLLSFREEGGDEPSDEDLDLNRQTIENLEVEGTATLAEISEEDGLRLAVIEVELEVTTHCGDTQELEEGEMEILVEIERSLSGRILWDLEHHHAHSAELEGHSSRLRTRSRTVENEEGDSVELEEAELLEGPIRYEATFERE